MQARYRHTTHLKTVTEKDPTERLHEKLKNDYHFINFTINRNLKIE